MNICEVPWTMNTKSVIAGLYTAPPGAAAHDDADLGHHSRGGHVALEYPAVIVKRDDSLLDPGAPSVVDPDERYAERRSEVDDFVDLLTRHFAERAAVHREVLGEEAHLFPVYGAETRDDAVGIRPFTVGGPLRPAASQHVQLLERPGVEEVVNAFASRHLAARVLTLYGRLATGVQGGLTPAFEFFQPFLHRSLGHGRQR